MRAESGGGRRTRKEAKGGKEKRGRVARFFLSLFPHLVIHKPRDDRRLPHGLVAQKDLRVVFFESRARGTRRGVGGLGGGGEERGRGRTRCAVFFFFFFFSVGGGADSSSIFLSPVSALRALPRFLFEREESFTLEALSDASSTHQLVLGEGRHRFLFLTFFLMLLDRCSDAEYSKLLLRGLALSIARSRLPRFPRAEGEG